MEETDEKLCFLPFNQQKSTKFNRFFSPIGREQYSTSEKRETFYIRKNLTHPHPIENCDEKTQIDQYHAELIFIDFFSTTTTRTIELHVFYANNIKSKNFDRKFFFIFFGPEL